jgi:RNA polymerase sigma factor (sigma-70 family)
MICATTLESDCVLDSGGFTGEMSMCPELSQTETFEKLLLAGAEGIEGVYDDLLGCAVERLYALSRRMLRSYPRLRCWEQTDDIFQTAALRLHQSLEEVQPESPAQFMGLAATQIRRTLIDLVRYHFGPEGKHSRHHSDAFDVHTDQPPEPLAHRVAKADEPETLEQWLRFHQGVELLPADERQVFEAVWYGNLTQQQVAELYKLSVSTVKRRMRSVRLRLGELLEEEALDQ